MQHPTLLILFICLQHSLCIALHPSERDLGLDFDDTFWSEAFPDGFNGRAADAVECATCGSTHKKLETRSNEFLGEVTKEEERLEIVRDVKTSLEKPRRRIIARDDNDDDDNLIYNTNPNVQPVTLETDQQVESDFRCVIKKHKQACQREKCIGDGGSCQVMIHDNGKEGCTQTSRSDNGILSGAHGWMRLPSCKGCKCSLQYRPKKLLNKDCHMVGVSSQHCPRHQAQQCYNAGARCIVKPRHPDAEYCARHTVNSARFQMIQSMWLRKTQSWWVDAWKTEACRGCSCTKRRIDKPNSWNNDELSKGATRSVLVVGGA